MNLPSKEFEPFGVGATEALKLRVSVATLAKVLFEHPSKGDLMLALEHRATLRAVEGRWDALIKAQPFGGGVRILNPKALGIRIGDYHFDSHRSKDEGDFRIFVHESNWGRVKRFCLQHFQTGQDEIFESGPERELVEEFDDALDIRITPHQYEILPLGVVIEDVPSATESARAQGSPTVRIYNTFEVHILDSSLVRAIMENSERHDQGSLVDLAWKDASRGGRGRANAMLALPVEQLSEEIQANPSTEASQFLYAMGYRLDENVLAVLEGIDTQKYQRYPPGATHDTSPIG